MIDRVAWNVTRNPLLRYLAVGAVCAVAGGVAGGVSALFGSVGGLQIVVKAGLMALAMAVGILACRWWWNALDEAAREAHKWAWWWGSTYGLAIGGVALLTLMTTTQDAALFAAWEPLDLLMAGAGFVLAVQSISYLIAWAAWWLQRR